MKTYILTIRKNGTCEKIKFFAKSKASIIAMLSNQFFINISPLSYKDIVLLHKLPISEQNFYYKPIEEYWLFNLI